MRFGVHRQRHSLVSLGLPRQFLYQQDRRSSACVGILVLNLGNQDIAYDTIMRVENKASNLPYISLFPGMAKPTSVQCQRIEYQQVPISNSFRKSPCACTMGKNAHKLVMMMSNLPMAARSASSGYHQPIQACDAVNMTNTIQKTVSISPWSSSSSRTSGFFSESYSNSSGCTIIDTRHVQ